MANAPQNASPHNELGSIWDLLTHVFLGSVLFALIFAPAVGLDILIRWLKEEVRVSEGLAWILTVTKYAVGGADAAVFLVFVARMSWDLLRKLIGLGGIK